MKSLVIFVLLQCCVIVFSDDGPDSRDIALDGDDDLGRKHRKKKKHQNNPCYGRTFGEKFGPQDYTSTYILAPVTNYFFGCGGLPVAPVYPQYGDQGHGGHGHGSHGHGSHGSHGHGGHGYGGGHGGHGGNVQGGYAPGYVPQNYGYNGYQQQFNQGFPGQNRPFQNVVSSAAAGLGNAVASYFSRPRKTYKQINRFINHLF